MKIYGENDNPLNSVQVPAIIINKLPESNNFKNSFPFTNDFYFPFPCSVHFQSLESFLNIIEKQSNIEQYPK